MDDAGSTVVSSKAPTGSAVRMRPRGADSPSVAAIAREFHTAAVTRAQRRDFGPQAVVTGEGTLKSVRLERVRMPTFELNLSDDVYAEFQQLAEQEFVSEEQAAEDLIASGIEAYNVSIVDDEPRDEMLDGAENNMFDTAQDPGSLEDDRL
jgi:hypothetical protein